MKSYKFTNKIAYILFLAFSVLVATNREVLAARPPSSNNNNNDVNVELPVDSAPADATDLQHALDTAPRGMDILEESFIQGQFYKSNDVSKKYNLNASKVIHRNESDANDRTGILRVTHGNNQLGSIWSNIDGNNYFDVTKDQTMSMWMYFGHPKDPSNANSVGDGMAFVLQNDDRGVNAISTYNGNPAYGETLGVWGADFNNKVEVPTISIAKTAIQKSFAIEFDTYLNMKDTPNVINGEGVSFDIGKYAKHIAMNYPDLPTTYIPKRTAAERDRRYYFLLNHQNSKNSMPLVDAQWHHVTMKWNTKNHTLYMKYDDKGLDGSAKDTPYKWEQSLDINHFDLKNTNKLRWGFTGSTGWQMENNLIIFESIPSYVNADSDVSIRDNTGNKMLTSGHNHVEVGDDLTFIYNLNYVDGSKDWEKVLATIDLPDNVIFNSATITYKGDEGNPESISLSSLNDKKIQFELSHSLSKNISQATIEVHANVDKVKYSTRVSPAHVRFESDNLIVDNDTPEFNIDVPALMMSTNPACTLNFGSMSQVPDSLEIHGEVWFANGGRIDPTIVTVMNSLNGNTGAMKLSGAIAKKASFVLYVDKKNLHIGQNNLKISAKNKYNMKTKEYEIIINIGGGLQFGNVKEEVSFVPVMAGTTNEMVGRQEGWQVEVVDSRPGGNSWQLQAKAEKLIQNETKDVLDGDVVYKNPDGGVVELHQATTIFTNVKPDDNVQTVDVASTWNNDCGIMLKLNSCNQAGSYRGRIHWCLVDSM